MRDPIIIANYFIKKSLETGQSLTPMKLLKLVYISHGWYLGITGNELINEGVQAWQYGPVIPSVYHAIKAWGKANINQLISYPQYDDKDLLSHSEKQFLDKIWDVYRDFDGLQLSSLTHQAGTPWYKTYHNNSDIKNQSAPIPNNLIKEHYLQKANSNKVSLNG